MLKKLFNYFWSLREQFIKYFIVGFSGVFLDLGTLIIFKQYLGLSAVLAVALNQFIVLIYNFTLNKYWSFGNRELPHKQIVRYLILAGINYFISVAVMYFFNQQLGYDYRLVRLATIVLMVCWNFFLYKYWVYQNTIQDTHKNIQKKL